MQEQPRKPDQLDALLARTRLSGPEYEFIAARVLDGVSRGARAKRLALYVAPALAAAAALVVALTLPDSDELRAKGARTAAPALEVACAGGGASSCPSGALLTFRVEDAAAPGYLHAWA